ncbi:hypothetical protein DID96_11670 [Burkholderia sp. Bp8963]|nr:hypothetical protein DID96_11670 [Burkholderia sp. Bp8963]
MTCRACGWHRVFRPRSDVIIAPPECPACGSADLDIRPAGPLDAPSSLLDHLLRCLKRLARKRR